MKLWRDPPCWAFWQRKNKTGNTAIVLTSNYTLIRSSTLNNWYKLIFDLQVLRIRSYFTSLSYKQHSHAPYVHSNKGCQFQLTGNLSVKFSFKCLWRVGLCAYNMPQSLMGGAWGSQPLQCFLPCLWTKPNRQRSRPHVLTTLVSISARFSTRVSNGGSEWGEYRTSSPSQQEVTGSCCVAFICAGSPAVSGRS